MSFHLAAVAQRGISVIVLSVLAGLPVTGTLCAALCDVAAGSAPASVAGAHAHHGTYAVGHDMSAPAHIGVKDAAGLDCRMHDGTGGEAVAVASSRGDSRVVAGVAIPTSFQASFGAASLLHARGPSLPEPSPTRALLVLRI